MLYNPRVLFPSSTHSVHARAQPGAGLEWAWPQLQPQAYIWNGHGARMHHTEVARSSARMHSPNKSRIDFGSCTQNQDNHYCWNSAKIVLFLCAQAPPDIHIGVASMFGETSCLVISRQQCEHFRFTIIAFQFALRGTVVWGSRAWGSSCEDILQP